MRSISYIKKLAIPYLIVISTILVIIGLATSKYFENFILENWQKELITEAKMAADQVLYSGAINDPESLAVIVDRLAVVTGHRVTVILPDGLVVAESSRDPVSLENHLLRPEIQAALSGRTEAVIRTSTTVHMRLMYAAAPLVEKGVIIAVIRLAKPMDQLDKTMAGFNRFLVITEGLGIVICVILMYLQSNKRVNPLSKVSEKIRQLSLGDLKKISPVARDDEIGTIITSFNTMVDKITLQIAEMQEDRNKMDAILSNMKDGVILVNEQGIVTQINPAAQKMFDIDLNSADGGSLTEVVRQHQVIDLWKRCQENRDTQSVLLQLSLDQEIIQATASPVEENLPGDVLLLFQDLTLVNKLQTVRQDFISNVSHELRTPLASLKVLAETLLDGAIRDPKAADQFLAQMDGEIDNLTQIVQELLELSKIESGRVPLSLQPISPDDLVAPAIERMRLQAERAGISLINNLPGDLQQVNADSNRIQQVLVNLLHNAIKFTNPGGSVTVAAVNDEKSIIFSVTDTGLGIAEDDQLRIFERFYKTDRSRASSGTGLGLSIARHLIDGHGGRIWVKSKIGTGSTFFFSLPKSTHSNK
jgi:two-component system phosphate regulon sensor histidine kinase PhoR